MSSKSIGDWARDVHRLANDKGWYERPLLTPDGPNVDGIGAKLMLIVSEVSEALEEVRNHPDALHMYIGDKGKPEGFVVELADAVIRILDLAEALGLNVEGAIEMKHAFNATRPARHGNKAL